MIEALLHYYEDDCLTATTNEENDDDSYCYYCARLPTTFHNLLLLNRNLKYDKKARMPGFLLREFQSFTRIRKPY